MEGTRLLQNTLEKKLRSTGATYDIRTWAFVHQVECRARDKTVPSTHYRPTRTRVKQQRQCPQRREVDTLKLGPRRGCEASFPKSMASGSIMFNSAEMSGRVVRFMPCKHVYERHTH